MKQTQNDMYDKAFKVAKRIGITVLCCVPVLIAFAYLTRNVIKSNALQIVCFTIIMGVAVLVVELVARKKEKTKKENQIEHKDVFK